MFGWEIGFDRPWYLLILLLLPVMWLLSLNSLSGLGNLRRFFALMLRTLVFTAIILALAEVQLLRTSDKMTVIYLLDQSQSIPSTKRAAMLEYAIREVRKHRDASRGDKAGVIVFGADARIEIPPFEDELPTIGNIENYLELRTDATNLASAMKLAKASFPEDSAKRIVIITDGNENLGDVSSIAHKLAREDGVGIDVVPVTLSARTEIDVEKFSIPSDLRVGQKFASRVVVNNYADPNDPNARVPGRLRLSQLVAGQDEEPLGDIPVTLDPGKNVYTFPNEIKKSAMYTYRAVFIPDDPDQDQMPQNNTATAYTHVRGSGHVLFIEDADHLGQFGDLISSLQEDNSVEEGGEKPVEVTRMSSDRLFTDPIELLSYDTVVLANVPRSSGDDLQGVSSFSDEQIKMLVKNTEEMGAGIVMLGGENSFGAGGWANTDLEKAMPVDFQIKNDKVSAVGALVMLMHASEMAQGNHWQKVIAQEAIKSLGPLDYCGLIHWDNQTGTDDWLWSKPKGLVQITGKRKSMMARVGRMVPGDMPYFEPAMKKALFAFNRSDGAGRGPRFASIKHMIVISDGDPPPPTNGTLAAYAAAKIKVTTVAVGAHGQTGHQTLQRIANATGGKYYKVTNPKALPRIYQREARRVAKPLIFDDNGRGNIPVQVQYPHEIIGSIPHNAFKTVDAYMLTTLKDSALIEQALIATKPNNTTNSTIMASWNYGLGRTVVFTSDVGQKWAKDWAEADYYDRFFGDMIRWSMRPINNEANFTVATDVRDGKVKIIVTALDKDDEFINQLNMSASVTRPDGEKMVVKMQQISAGRYVGEVEGSEAGSYLFAIKPEDYGLVTGGVNVPFSSEFRDRQTNDPLLDKLATIQPKGGKPGVKLVGNLSGDGIDTLLKTDTFRHTLEKAISSQDVWPLFVLVCATLFFADVFIRRVAISFEWLAPVWAWISRVILRRQAEQAPDERMSRLKSLKADVGERIEERRAAARFEPQPDTQATAAPSLEDVVEQQGSAQTPLPPPTQTSQMSPDAPEDDSYTSRLLKAKKKAFRDENET